MDVTFVGCGDAFGSGGRLNTCFHVRAARTSFLIDCGASSLIGMNRCGIDRNAIDTILVTHFHADHFGGVPFFMLDAQFNTKRTRPLTIAGPPGLREFYPRAMETAFTGSSKTPPRFELNLVELESAQRRSLGDITVRPARVRHAPAEGPFFAYRIDVDGKTIAFSGDTEWVEIVRKESAVPSRLRNAQGESPAHQAEAVDPDASQRGHARTRYRDRLSDRRGRIDGGGVAGSSVF